jgi:hypothetical protein
VSLILDIGGLVEKAGRLGRGFIDELQEVN